MCSTVREAAIQLVELGNRSEALARRANHWITAIRARAKEVLGVPEDEGLRANTLARQDGILEHARVKYAGGGKAKAAACS